MRIEYGVYNRSSKPSRIFSAGSQRSHADSWSGGRANNQYFSSYDTDSGTDASVCSKNRRSTAGFIAIWTVDHHEAN